jgi:osmotically-inducible protein OsmY
MTDEQLMSDAQDELLWDPRIDNEAIAVTAQDGVVTLRGTVGSFRERREAVGAVKRVYGTMRVENELEVRLLNGDRRDDADLRGDVLQALMLDALVPSSVNAKAKEGLVTLMGTTNYQFERDEAEFIAGNVPGVVWIDNDINLTPPTPSAGDVENAITKAMKRDAKLDAEGIRVESQNGTVQLSGNVRSWAEHDAAVNAAWAAPGVSNVDDRLYVAYSRHRAPAPRAVRRGAGTPAHQRAASASLTAVGSSAPS